MFILTYLASLAVHEAAHLVILFALGGEGSLIVSPWRFKTVNFTTYGLHLQTTRDVGSSTLFVVNVGGPLISAFVLIVWLRFIESPMLKTVFVGNAVISVFFAIAEGLYALGDVVYGFYKTRLIELAFFALATPEANLLFIILGAYVGLKLEKFRL